DRVAAHGGGADWVGGRAVQKDAVERVDQGGRPVGGQSDVVADHLVVGGGGAADGDAVLAVAGDDVAGRRDRAANGVVGRGHNVHAAPAVGQRGGAGGVGANVVALDHVAAAGDQVDAVAGEAVNHQALHRAAAGGDRQAGDAGAGAGPVDLDQWRPCIG